MASPGPSGSPPPTAWRDRQRCGFPKPFRFGSSAGLTPLPGAWCFLDGADRQLLHRDHAGMLEAFIARDADALIRVCTEHHRRLQTFIALLPQHTGLFAEPD